MAGIVTIPLVSEAVRAGLDVCKTVPSVVDTARQFLDNVKVTDFQGRYRSLELVVVNASRNKLCFKDEYFFSGRWYTSIVPLTIDPGEVAIGLVSNRQNAWAGVTGGISYEVEGTPYNLCIGFTNPWMGTTKSFIMLSESESAYWAYCQAEDDSIKFVREFGYELTCTRHVSDCCPFGKLQFSITEVEK